MAKSLFQVIVPSVLAQYLSPMRICHFSDSHLGYGQGHARRAPSGLTMRQEDVILGFRTAVERIINIGPDLCIHSGDLFDSVRPLNSIMALAGEQLYRLAEGAGVPTVIIAGNHDAPKQPFVGAAIDVYRQIDNLYVASSGKLEVFELLGGMVHAIPHCLTGEVMQQVPTRCVGRFQYSRHTWSCGGHAGIFHGRSRGTGDSERVF